jgi:hypothetical protein
MSSRSFVAGYLAAVRNYSGAFGSERGAVIALDAQRAAERAYRDPDWIEPLIDDLLADAAGETDSVRRQRVHKKPDREGHVYVLYDAERDTYKVGFTQDVVVRTAQIQAASGAALILVRSREGTTADERRLHAQMAEHRRHGEWFHMNDTLREWLAA